MTSVGAEGEVEQRVDHGGGVDRPLHHRDVGLAHRDEGVQGQPVTQGPVSEHVVHIEQLERSSAGLEDEDEEESDQGQPEVGGAETTGAASGGLDEEREPGDDQEDDGQDEGEEEAGQVEVDVGRLSSRQLSPFNWLVHADGGVLGATGDDVLVRIILPVPDVSEEGGGHRKQGREEPDERDVDGVGPGPGHVLTLSPLGVLDKQMPGQEQDGQRQEEQQAVVEISEMRKEVENVK